MNHQCTAAPPKVTPKKCEKDVDCPGQEVCEANQCRVPGGGAVTSAKYPIEIIGKDGAPMRLVPAGKFTMGSTQKDGEQQVDLKDYYMDVYEVTVARYVAFLRQSGHKDEFGWNASVLKQHADGKEGTTLPYSSAATADAMAYCHYYGKRVPTEAEWEKAARGTDGRDYPWGDEDPTPQHAAFGSMDSSRVPLKPIGSFEKGKSPYGMYDMAGNAAELVFDEDSSSLSRKYGAGEFEFLNLRGGATYDDKMKLLVWEKDHLCWETCKGYLRDPDLYKAEFGGTNKRHIGFRCAADPSR
ncbi:MAG: SUMF1/EgtB/PvdO family nonheme iron enzyme [Nitrospira sp.]